MSSTENYTAAREALACARSSDNGETWRLPGKDFDLVVDTLEALATELAEAEARVERLQLYLMVIERAYDRPDVREVYNAAVIPEQRLQPGDVRTDDDHLSSRPNTQERRR